MLIITGTGRSGTSAVARLVHEAGITVGRDLIEADSANEEGYFEERAVVRLNDQILTDVGLDRWFATATREEVLSAARHYHDGMRALVAGATPAWKDPRFSWTLESWLEVLPQRPRLIVCLRSPAEVIASTMRYYGLVDDDARRAIGHVWRTQYERLLEMITGHRLEATCVEFDMLQDDPPAAARIIEEFIRRPVDIRGVRADLRHHRESLPEDFASLYDRVRALRM